jgi:hypothetical protein
MTEKDLPAIRHAVCAIGWIPLTSEEYYANPKRDKFARGSYGRAFWFKKK